MAPIDVDQMNSTSLKPTSHTNPDENGVSIATTAVMATSLSFILLIVCFLNFLVTFTFYKKAYLVTSSNRFIFSLTMSNFIFGVVVLPFNLISCICGDWVFGVMWCNLTGFVTVSVTAGGMFTVMVITIDRYFAISQPMLYPVKLTSTRTVELIILVWILAVVCSLLPVFGWSRYRYDHSKSGCFVSWRHHPSYTLFFTILCLVVPFLVICCCYLKILQVAHVTQRRISNGNVVTTTGNPKQRRRSRRTSLLVNIRMASPTKALRTVAITVGAILVIWGPVTAELLYEAFNGFHVTPSWMQTAVTLLWYADFIMHPCIYAVWNRSIRLELLSWFFDRVRWIDDEQPLLFIARKDACAVSVISGSITDLSYTASLQSKAVAATGIRNSSNDSGTVLTCIEETDDAEINDELLKIPSNSLGARKTPAQRVNRLQTIVDVHTPIGFIEEDSAKSHDIKDQQDEGILEDA